MGVRYRYYIYILLLSVIHSVIVKPALSQTERNLSVDSSINKAVEIADQKQREANEKAALINSYFNKGKASYQSRKYMEAVRCFEKIIDIDPSYEPAKLYLESAIIQQRIAEAEQEIKSIKLMMADIIAEYDRRRENVDSLAIKYFLEQAQRKCQLGDFEGAEQFYNLCYKVYPYSKDKIEWFIKATHDLLKLSRDLDEHSKKIEELAASMSGSSAL